MKVTVLEGLEQEIDALRGANAQQAKLIEDMATANKVLRESLRQLAEENQTLRAMRSPSHADRINVLEHKLDDANDSLCHEIQVTRQLTEDVKGLRGALDKEIEETIALREENEGLKTELRAGGCATVLGMLAEAEHKLAEAESTLDRYRALAISPEEAEAEERKLSLLRAVAEAADNVGKHLQGEVNYKGAVFLLQTKEALKAAKEGGALE